MKSLLIASLVSLSSLTAFAQPIHLQAGNSVVVNGDLITCEAPTDSAVPLCSIKQDGSYYRVYTGNTIAESYYYFNDAIEGVKKLKAAGLCR